MQNGDGKSETTWDGLGPEPHKLSRQQSMENHIDNGEWQTAAMKGESELKHSRL